MIQEINHQKKEKNKGIKNYALFAGAGININSSEFIGVGNFKESRTQSPKIVLGFDIFQNAVVKRFIFRAEIGLSYNKPTFVINNTHNSDSYSFNQYNASLIPQIIYNIYNAEKLKFYIGGGASFNFSKYNNIKYIDAYGNELNKPYQLASSWANFPVQTGMFINNNLEFSLKYLHPTSYFQYNTISSISTRTFSLSMHYFLNKKKTI